MSNQSRNSPETRAENVTLPKEAKLPKAVVGLGLVSLFTDASSEAIFPLLPAFLTMLGASNAFIGLVEGAADLVANVLKYLTGIAADRRIRLKPFVLVGYGISTLLRPLVAFAVAPWHVLAVRVGDRIGKGIRSSPRDALIAAATEPSIRGRAYGFHRAMDHSGAAIGTLLGAGLLWFMGATSADAATADQMRNVFLWAAIPGVFRDDRAEPDTRTRNPELVSANSNHASSPAAGSEKSVGANCVVRFRQRDGCLHPRQGSPHRCLTDRGAPSLAGLHVIKASTATAGGRLADQYGRRNALALGWTVYAVTWSSVGFAETVPLLFVLTAIYGTSHGLVEGAEKALIAELADGQGRGKAFGAYNMLIGFAALAASTLFGLVWDQFGGLVAFAGTGVCALSAAALLLLIVPNR